MALSTTQYGYIIDPMVPFTDDKGNTIKDGFVRVFVAGSSTPVVTYRNFDGAANQDLIELDNSGRTKTSVIGSKGLTYKVCVYDQLHSQESPILTVDKVSAIGANITAGSGATVVTGLDGLTTKPDGFVDASVIGTDGYVSLDHTLVTDDLNTDAKVTAVENDRYIPLLNDDVNDPDSKITLGRLWQWVLGKIKSLSTSITAFRTGDVIPVDGPSGTAKMSKDTLLALTAQNAQRTKTILSNGSCGNYGNATGIVTYNVIPTNGADFVRVGMNVPLDEGETYEIDYCFFKVDSGIVPNNAPGAVPSAQRTAINEVYGTEGFLDIEVPDGYIGIGFAFFKIVGGSSVSIQDATHKNGATYSLLYSPEEVNEKFAQFDGIINKLPFVPTALKNGSCGNSGNAYTVVTWNVIPTNGADYIRVKMTQPLPEGYTYMIEYCFFTVDSGVVPNNATGAVPSSQRTGITYIRGTDGTLDIKVPDGYIGIGFAFTMKDQSNADVSIQDDSHRNGATYSLLNLPEEVNEKFAQIEDGIINKLPFVSTALKSGSCGNAYNRDAIVTWNVIPINRATHFRVTMNQALPEGYSYEVDYCFFKVDSGIVPNNAPGAVPSAQRTAINEVYGVTDHLDIEIQEGYIGIGFAWWLKDENGQNVSIQNDAYRNGASFARLFVPNQITGGIADNHGLVLGLNEFCGDLDFVDSVLTLANGSKPNPSNAYAVHGEYNKNLNVGDIVRVNTDVVTDENAVFQWDIYEYKNGSPVVSFSTTYDAANRIYDYTIRNEGIDQVSFTLLGRIGSSAGERITFRVATFDGRITCAYSLKSSLNSRLSALEVGTITAYNRNAERAIELNAACRRSKTANDSKDFQLLIVTDVHQDTVAEDNAIDMANNFDSIACVFNCGDEMASFYNISNPAGNSGQYVSSISKSQKPYFFAIGNHEAGTFNFIQYCPTSAMMYASFIKPLVDKGFIGVGEYEVDKCYYYHDFTTEKIRLVVLNEYDSPLEVDDTKWNPITYDSTLSAIAWSTSYEVGDKVNVKGFTDYSFECKVDLTTPSSIYGNTGDVMPRYKLTPGYRYIGQTQAQWFLDTLEDTPADYSVIVMLHNPFSDLAVVQNKKFSQPSDVGKYGSAFSQNNMVTDFIADAVHAFMTKDASYSQVVTMKNGATYSVSKDFSSVASGVKFLCYIGGHSHHDLVWKHSTYTDQWQVSPICANTTNYAQYTGADIRRTTQDGYAKDSVTCVAFNIADRVIRLSKLGVNITEDMTYRDFEKIGLS